MVSFNVTKAETLHPVFSVYVIKLVPCETLVTKPLLSIVATLSVAETHGGVKVAGVPEPCNCVVDPQNISVPVMVGASTVTVALPDVLPVQLFASVTITFAEVYVVVEVGDTVYVVPDCCKPLI